MIEGEVGEYSGEVPPPGDAGPGEYMGEAPPGDMPPGDRPPAGDQAGE